jgi:hypothetical protein
MRPHFSITRHEATLVDVVTLMMRESSSSEPSVARRLPPTGRH